MNRIFLHFLNRELLRSVGLTVPATVYIEEIKILAISTSFQLYSNYANIIEGSYLSSDFFREMVSNSVIQIYGEKDTFEEFWYSREPRYSFDKERYPYLSQINYNNISLKPALVRDFSMTKKLRSNIFSFNQEKNDEIGLLNNYSEKDSFWRTINKIAQYDGEDAITMSLIANLITSTANRGANISLTNIVGRLLSYIYLKEILISLNANIATGILGLSFFDRISNLFPVNNISLLKKILEVCGTQSNAYSVSEIINYFHSADHHTHSDQISSILRTLYELNRKDGNVSVSKDHIIQILDTNRIVYDASRKDLLNLGSRLNQLVRKLSHSQSNFADIHNFKGMSNVILIITATTKESSALIESAKSVLGSIKDTSVVGGHVANYFGTMNDFQIYHAQCEAGSGGPSGSQAVATALIQSLKPMYILMPGIAFGLQRDSQKIGDILVGTLIHPYEKQRVGKIKLNRGEIVPPSPTLLSVLRNVSIFWTKSDMHFGALLSGEKLVDNPDFVKQLKKLSPEAIGGEMEGAGIYAAAYRAKVEWIVFKSIVDWGEGKTDEFQPQSSNLCSEVLLQAITILTK